MSDNVTLFAAAAVYSLLQPSAPELPREPPSMEEMLRRGSQLELSEPSAIAQGEAAGPHEPQMQPHREALTQGDDVPQSEVNRPSD